MTPVMRSIPHDPSNGLYGDCHRACIASLLDLPLEEVPHFAHDNPSGEVFWDRQSVFLDSHGLAGVNVAFVEGTTREHLRRYCRTNCPGVYCILGGTSPLGVDHSVVACDGDVVHDPSGHPPEEAIVGPCGDGVYWLTFFVPKRFTKGG